MALMQDGAVFATRVRETFQKLSPRNRWIAAGVGALIVGLVFSMVFFSAGDGPWAPIQSPVRDLAAAQTELGRYGIDSRFSTDKADLLVPRERRERAILILNAARLLPDGLRNYEFLGQADFTSTEPQRYERIRVQIEDLLRGTINAMEGVRQATVRITPASRELLFRPDSGRNKASVTVDLTAQAKLSPQQAASIAQLVSSSYPSLAPEDVFIMDTAGRPYSFRPDAQTSADRFELRRNIEKSFEDKAERALAGFDAIVAATVEVSVIDERQRTSLEYQPDGSDAQVGHRETIKEKRNARVERGTAGIRAESQNSNRTDVGGGAMPVAEERTESREQMVLDQSTLSELERMKLVVDYPRSSLAVSLSEAIAPDDDARESVRARARALVAGATGFETARIAIEFTPRAIQAASAGLMPSAESWIDRWGGLAGGVVLTLLMVFALIVLYRAVRGTATTQTPVAEGGPVPPPEEGASAAVIESNRVFEQVNQMIDKNPRAAANLMKRWILFNE